MAVQLFVPKFEVQECMDEIRECLEKGWTGLGFKTLQFEEDWKRYTGLPFAYYLNSATIGLNFAVEILKEEHGWKDGDEIISTPITFVSTNHAILRAGLKAVFADIDDTMCLDPASVEERITEKTRAVIFVGIGGNVGHYFDIVRICKEKGLKLILDAAHMAGTRMNGKIPGHEADAVVYSFQAVKNLPTADSGMLCFKDGKLDETARKKGWLGINKDTYTRTLNSGNYKWRYDVEYVGEKAHGNSVMAAIAIAQLRYLERDNAYRRQIAKWYQEYFSEYFEKIGMVHIVEGCESSFHLFQILVENRDQVIISLNQHGIYPGVHYADNTAYRMYAYDRGKCPHAEYVSEHVLSLPMHLRLSHDDVEFVSKKVIETVNACG